LRRTGEVHFFFGVLLAETEADHVGCRWRILTISMLSRNMAQRALVAIFAINAVAAAAAAIVLAVAPGVIPSVAGIEIDRSQNLMPYLLAAAELAIAALAALAIRSRSTEAKRIAISVLITFHAGSAVAGIAAVTQGAGIVVTLNVAVRLIIIAALAVCAPARIVGTV